MGRVEILKRGSALDAGAAPAGPAAGRGREPVESGAHPGRRRARRCCSCRPVHRRGRGAVGLAIGCDGGGQGHTGDGAADQAAGSRIAPAPVRRRAGRPRTTAREVAAALGVPPERVFKSLVDRGRRRADRGGRAGHRRAGSQGARGGGRRQAGGAGRPGAGRADHRLRAGRDQPARASARRLPTVLDASALDASRRSTSRLVAAVCNSNWPRRTWSALTDATTAPIARP